MNIVINKVAKWNVLSITQLVIAREHVSDAEGLVLIQNVRSA